MDRVNNETYGKKTVAKRRLLIVLIVVCVAVFAVSAYMLIQYYMVDRESENAFDELRLPAGDDAAHEDPDLYAKRQAHYRDLYAQNDDFVGWLKIFDTKVDYPVMQTPDERDYYLHRDFNKKYSAAGALFASDISDVDRPSDVVIIFGHMMKSGSMFGGLKEYTDADYLEGHRVARLDTLTEERFYRIFCVFVESVNTGKSSEFRYYDVSDFADEAAFDEFMSKAKSKELYDTGDTAAYGDEILALSTCEYTHEDGRLVLLAKRFTPGGDEAE
ncbi:MAG: class B sortase [Clostridiales Family XIII bacterium]|jgi:sortase B|nr:class B sortase [Clostridiales Family XIII bacterium]